MGCLSVAYPLPIPCCGVAGCFGLNSINKRWLRGIQGFYTQGSSEVHSVSSRQGLGILSGVYRGSVGGRSADRGLNLLFYWLQEEQKTGLQRA